MFRFPWGDMHSLNLGWFLQKFNELREDWATAEAGIDGALDAEIEKAEDALSDVFAARDAAAASATAAAGSASSAGTSATAAGNSATAAASSATLANQKATAAGLSEAAAAQSATAASNSATAAAGSATTASTAATNAAASQTAAAASETAATTAAQTATTKAGEATTAAATCEEVLESIPEDYSDLSAEVNTLSNVLGEVQKHPFNSLYFTLDDTTHNITTSQNERTINIKHNHIKTTNIGNTGSTFATCLLSGDGRIVGSNDTSVLNNLTEDDFTDIYIPENYALFMDIDYIGEKTSVTGTHGAGSIIVATMNKITQEIKLFGIGSFGLSNLKNKAVSFRVNLIAEVPEIFENQNICFLYRSRYADIAEEWSISVYETPFTYSAANTFGTITKPIAYQMPMFTANKNLVENEIVLIGNNLYIITAPIALGEQVINGTNAQYTTIGNLITQILNS